MEGEGVDQSPSFQRRHAHVPPPCAGVPFPPPGSAASAAAAAALSSARSGPDPGIRGLRSARACSLAAESEIRTEGEGARERER